MDQTAARHRCAEALTRLGVFGFVIQATMSAEVLDKPEFLHFSPVRSMMPPMAMQMRSCSVRWSDD